MSLLQRRGTSITRTARIGAGVSLAFAAVESSLDILPRVHEIIRGTFTVEHQVASPRVEVGGVRVSVGRVWRTVDVEDELVRREELVAVVALDALGTGAVVTPRQEASAASPAAGVSHAEHEVGRESRGRRITDEQLDQSLRLSLSDDAAASGGGGHRAGSSQHGQLQWTNEC